MQTKQETGLLVRLWADEAAAFFFVGLLWLLALAGVSGYRPAAAAACGLLLLTHLRPWLAIAATAIAVLSLVKPGATSTAMFALQAAAFLATLFAFRAAAVGPGLSSWQAAATGTTWLFLGGPGQTWPGIALLALILLRAAFARAASAERD